MHVFIEQFISFFLNGGEKPGGRMVCVCERTDQKWRSDGNEGACLSLT